MIETHTKLSAIEYVLDVYVNAKGEDYKSMDSKESLEFSIAASMFKEVSDLLYQLEYMETICISCFYSTMDNMRKSIHRYMLIEKDLSPTATDWFTSIHSMLNEICILVKKDYRKLVDKKECERVKNDAFNEFSDDLNDDDEN